MRSSLYSVLINIASLGLLVGALFLITRPELMSRRLQTINPSPQVHVDQIAAVSGASSTPMTPEPQIMAENEDKLVFEQTEQEMEIEVAPPAQTTQSDSEISRIQNPYSFPTLDSNTLNQDARMALVNLLCESSNPSLKSISGSGILIDPRGILVTNAHVAQYVLLASSAEQKVSCTIRTGSPAQAQYVPEVLYFPSKWVALHAADITNSRPVGTGEHDYALLRISKSTNGTPLPDVFPYLPFDERERIGFAGDPILITAYPAEFGGSSAARSSLYASSVFTTIKQMLTFSDTLVDMISLGGTAVAQSGSSGGGVVNMWGRVIGIVSTTSEGATTETRDLRAITFAHIDRSIRDHTGISLRELLARDPAAQSMDFASEARQLSNVLIAEIEKRP